MAGDFSRRLTATSGYFALIKICAPDRHALQPSTQGQYLILTVTIALPRLLSAKRRYFQQKSSTTGTFSKLLSSKATFIKLLSAKRRYFQQNAATFSKTATRVS
jgi:hypothetical protein